MSGGRRPARGTAARWLQAAPEAVYGFLADPGSWVRLQSGDGDGPGRIELVADEAAPAAWTLREHGVPREEDGAIRRWVVRSIDADPDRRLELELDVQRRRVTYWRAPLATGEEPQASRTESYEARERAGGGTELWLEVSLELPPSRGLLARLARRGVAAGQDWAAQETLARVARALGEEGVPVERTEDGAPREGRP